jgi:predicted nucleic acid-binding protein
LQVALKRNRIKKPEHQEYLQSLNRLPINVDKFCSTPESLHIISKLSHENDLTTYDAAYLELALRLDAKLATFDQKLKAASAKNKLKTLP